MVLRGKGNYGKVDTLNPEITHLSKLPPPASPFPFPEGCLSASFSKRDERIFLWGT
jgi:hypothetical protein